MRPLVALGLAVLLAAPARADCRCTAPVRCTAPLVDGACPPEAQECPAEAEVVCPSPDFTALMQGLQDATHDRDVARAGNAQLAAELAARLVRVQALEALQPEPAWPWALAGAGAGLVAGVALVLFVR